MRDIGLYEGSFEMDHAEPLRFSQSQEQNSQDDSMFLEQSNNLPNGTAQNIKEALLSLDSPNAAAINIDTPSAEMPSRLQMEDEKTIAANKTYKYHPSDYMHGMLNKQSIQNNVLGEKLLDDMSDWRVQAIYDDKKDSGYYGVLYVDAHNCHTVLVHQSGTPNWWKDLSIGNVLSNQIEMIFGRTIVQQQAKAYLAMKDAVDYSKAKQYHLSTTGFGFGALLAEISVYYCWWSFDYKKIKAVTFESPGSLALIEKLKANVRNSDSCVNLFNLDIVTYLTMPNMLNCNGHLGTVYQIPPDKDNVNWQQKIATLFASASYTDAASATIDVILQHIKPTSIPNLLKVLDWPQISYANQTLFAVTKIDTTEICKTMLPLPAFLSKMLFDKMDKILCDFTPYSFIKLCFNMLTGNLNFQQYWHYSVQDNPSPQRAFEITYVGHYKTVPVEYFTKAFNKDAGDEEYYLSKLKKYSSKLQNYSGLNATIKKQLEELSNEYKFIGTGKKLKIQTQKMTIAELYTWVKRLIELYAAELDCAIEYVKKRQDYIKHDKIAADLPQPVPYFTGRDQFFTQVNNSLQNNEVVIISGYGGVGKSAFASEYGKRMQSAHNVRWFNSRSTAKLREGYRCLASELGIETMGKEHHILKNQIYAKLSGYGDVLFVFDGVECYSDIADYLNFPPNIKLLITTRQQNLGFSNRCQHFAMSPFSAAEAFVYVKNASTDKLILDGEIHNLIETIGMLPYRLNYALAYLKNNKLTPVSEYLMQYKNNVDKQILIPGWALTIEKLVVKDALSWEIAQYLAWLDASFIPISLLQQLGYDRAALQHAEVQLSSFSLASLVMRGPLIAGLSMPKLVQEDIKVYTDIYKDDCIPITDILWKLTKALVKVFPSITDNPSMAWRVGQLYAACAWQVLAGLQEYASTEVGEISNRLLQAKLYTKLADYTANVELDYVKSLEYYQQCLAIKQNVVPDNYAEIASAYSNIGRAFEKLGRVQEGLHAKQEALALYRKQYGNMHAQIAKELSEIGNMHQLLGHDEASLNYSQQSVKMFEELNTGERPQFVASLSRLSCAYRKVNDFTNSLYYSNVALQMGERIFGENHPIVAGLYNNFGVTEYKMGDISNAIKHIKRSVDIYERLYSGEHRLLVSAYINIGVIYGALGNAEYNLYYNKDKALSMCNNLYTSAHHHTAGVLYNVGMAYQQLRDIPQAIQYLSESLSMYKLLYNEEHPKIIKITEKLDLLLRTGTSSSSHTKRPLHERSSLPDAKRRGLG